jgi:6-phosphogluconolactonase
MHRAALTVLMTLAVAAGAPALARPEKAGKAMIYVGTYTSGDSKGIYRLQLDLATGALASAGAPTETVNPSFLALHPSGRFLYAVNETGDAPEDPSGGVSAFAVDAATAALTFLNRQPSEGAAPCHLTVDKAGRHLLVANYWGGTVAVLPIAPDGRLGAATSVIRHRGHSVHPQQKEPHPHSVNLDAANRFAFVADLGLDQVITYGYDAKDGRLTQSSVASAKAGAGPRHLTLAAGGRRAFVINEIDSTLTRYSVGDGGTLRAEQTVPTLPAGFGGQNSTAEVALHPRGGLVFGSNRGHDTIAIFAVDAATGALSAKGHEPTRGKNPRHFAVDPSGAFLLAANQASDTVAVYRIDAGAGRLQAVGEPFRVPRPVCVRFAN